MTTASVHVYYDNCRFTLFLPRYFAEMPLAKIRKLFRLLAARADRNGDSFNRLDRFFPEWADIVGKYDKETGAYTGLELVSQCFPRLGVLPCVLTAPGFSHIPEVAIALQIKTTGVNGVFSAIAIADIDPAAAPTYDRVYEWKNQNGYTGERLIACWPKAKIGDREIWLSTLVAARIAQTDAENDGVPYVSPSNKSLPITRTVNGLGAPVYLDQTQASALDGLGIVTALNMQGWRLWGNNTAAYPATTDPKDRWIAARRMFSWWGNSFILTYFQRVDSPLNRRLIQSILDSENVRANGYTARGMIAGARIEWEQDKNPITDILDGTLRFYQYLSIYTPSETIVNTLEFDADQLRAALGGD